MWFPSPLRKGDRAALLAPASPFADEARLDLSVRALTDAGLEPVLFKSARAADGYLAAPDAVRAADLNRAFADDSIRAVFCMRGGYGCLRILDLLDYSLIRAHPKLLCGFSDVTVLSMALAARCGMSTLHAPMPFRWPELTKSAGARLKNSLFASTAAEYSEHDGLYSLQSGRVTAPFFGGNLTLLAALAASDYLPDLSGVLLFLEDVGEKTYQIDRALYTLKLARVFDRVAGVVLGSFTEGAPENEAAALVRECVPEHIPVLGGFPAGHTQNNHAFFQGQTATLDGAHLTFYDIKESR